VTVLERKNFESPDESRDLVAKGHIEALHLEAGTVRRSTYEPGWRWSEHVGPLAGSTICNATHFGMIVSGSQAVELVDGTQIILTAGDVFSVPPGHDGWTIGDEPCVVVDFSGSDPFGGTSATAAP
jgi:quercetin dioxygenase-like cupin family protein